MHGRILLIDPIATNRILLRVKLAAAHFVVEQADSIAEAVQMAQAVPPDVILCAAEMPDGDAARLLREMAALERSERVPVMAVIDREDADERLRLLRAGIDEVATRPVNDAVLIARLRSLVRVSSSASEWQLRDDTTRALGFAERPEGFAPQAEVILVGAGNDADLPWLDELASQTRARLRMRSPATALNGDSGAAAYILPLTRENQAEMLPLLSAIRSMTATRHSGILVVQRAADPVLTAHALDLGAGELVDGAFHAAELALRLERLIACKDIADHLRATVRTGLEAAVSDPLTGLHNRRYALPHLARIADRAQQQGKPFAVMVADMDHFKRINDQHGHAAGDAVLVQTAERLRENVRGVDLVARIGGEEFLIVLPATGLDDARHAARRLCHVISETPFELPDGLPPLLATISIGMTVWDPGLDLGADRTLPPLRPEALLDRADKALYGAKASGRNRVLLDRSAA